MTTSRTLVLVSALIALAAWVTVRGADRSQERLDACEANLKQIGTAMEVYSADYSGRYASRLDHLRPRYLAAMPTCPAAGFDTYSAAFESGG